MVTFSHSTALVENASLARMDDFHGTPPEIQIKAEDDIAKGRFANLAQVGSTIDSFALDFAFVQGRTGWLLARLLITPGHAKRFHQVLGDTIARYEERFGPIDLGPAIQ